MCLCVVCELDGGEYVQVYIVSLIHTCCSLFISHSTRSRIIEGVDVFKEILSSSSGSFSSSTSSSSTSSVVGSTQTESSHMHSHVDFVCDLAIVPYKNQQFLVSASHEGVIKLWK